MKAAFVALAFAASALAQAVTIPLPPPGSIQMAGETIPVVVQKIASLTGSTDISVAIGIQTCPTGDCDDIPKSNIGTILFTGAYAPQLNAEGNDVETYLLGIPSDLPNGLALLSAAHFYILGASNMAELDIAHTTINITDSH
ncbi:hypothetical protein C8Q70DRAFT_370092 [Cubamyces menziesii]|uniref:Uncharacterized protein n=1 Tax=Trametes cubensis TaxID=1111947 RepID=A0AAD7U4H2_9APHY|nr:hypothetical protein C8Q70DRAFT_370092 [Cubamyces menziesii]KAJ8496506.1 hypothetical protein ONZ51_g1117 [Trametes cubensis]